VEWAAAVADSDTAQLSITEFKPGRSRETGVQLEDMLRLAAREAFAPAHSAATITVESPEAIRHAEGPASAVAASMAGAVTAVAAAVDMPGTYKQG